MRTPYYESTIYRQIKEKRANRRERVRNEIDLYGSEILNSDEMKEAYGQIHHLWSTVGEHTIRVTLTSVMICYALRKLNIKVNVPAVVIASLCHDLGILGRDEKFSSEKESLREHPIESVRVAKELVDELPEGSEDIIERHMWPAGKSKAPNSIEGVVVSVADKYTAVKDLVKGSDIMNTGVRNVAHEKKEEFKEKKDELRESIQEKLKAEAFPNLSLRSDAEEEKSMFRKMRRSPQALSHEEMIDLLKTETRGVMSVQGDNGYPYGVPINHFYDEETGKLYFHGANFGHRVDAVKRDPKVSYCVFDQGKKDEGDWAYRVKSVIIFGRAELIDDPAEMERISRKLCEKFPCPQEYIDSEIEKDLGRTLCIAVSIEDMNGKLVHEA